MIQHEEECGYCGDDIRIAHDPYWRATHFGEAGPDESATLCSDECLQSWTEERDQ